jgi:hypothetical protein
MWYTGIDSIGINRILYCTSRDGTVWSKGSLSLDIGSHGLEDSTQACTPYVIKESDNLYKMWYIGNHQKIIYCTSTDGITWTTRTSGITTELFCCAWGEGVYTVAGAGGVIRTSPDSATWTARTSGVTTSIVALNYNNVQPYQYYSGGVFATSSDAVTWTSRNDHGNTTEMYDIFYNAALPSIDFARSIWGSTQSLMSSSTYPTPNARNTYYNTIYEFYAPGDAYTPNQTRSIGTVEAVIYNYSDSKTLTFDGVMSYNDQTDDTSGFRLLRDNSVIQAFTVAPSGSYSYIFAPMTLGPNSFTRIRWQYTITAGSGTDDQYLRFFKFRLLDLA